MKGKKSSETLNQLLRELHQMRGSEMSQLLMKRTHDVYPFEDVSVVESTSVKYDCSLFAVGSHQKKRPDNLTLGRVFDGHVLDMFEMGVENYKGCDKYAAAEHITQNLKPILIFQGEPFDNSDKHKRLKNLLIDFFRIQDMQEANIAELQRVIVFTCRGEAEPIEMNHLECGAVSETLVKKNAVPFKEIGPSFSMRLRRDKIAGTDLFKEACRKPKVLNPEKKKANKNRFTDELGETKGKVFVQQQALKTLNLRKFGKKTKRDDSNPKEKVEAVDV